MHYTISRLSSAGPGGPGVRLIRRICRKGIALGLFWGLSIGLTLGVAFCETPELDTDTLLKPLVDTSQPAPGVSDHLQGSAKKQGHIPVNIPNTSPASKKPLVLTGKVQTLQQAIESEKDTVDWYAWYLSARQYLAKTGGLRCALGTPIKFYRDGSIEALTFDPYCLVSVANRRFPLPPNTSLDALILPVRPGEGPPASRQEIYSRIQSNRQFK